jgi:hypothetical protein
MTWRDPQFGGISPDRSIGEQELPGQDSNLEKQDQNLL